MSVNRGPLRIPRLPKLMFSLAAAGNSGVLFTEAAGFHDWNFQIAPNTLGQAVTGATVSIYGTMDPLVLKAGLGDIAGNVNSSYPLPGATGGAWFLLPAKSVESSGDTAVWSNPMTAITQALRYTGLLMAVCAVLTGTPSNTLNCYGWTSD